MRVVAEKLPDVLFYEPLLIRVKAAVPHRIDLANFPRHSAFPGSAKPNVEQSASFCECRSTFYS